MPAIRFLQLIPTKNRPLFPGFRRGRFNFAKALEDEEGNRGQCQSEKKQPVTMAKNNVIADTDPESRPLKRDPETSSE